MLFCTTTDNILVKLSCRPVYPHIFRHKLKVSILIMQDCISSDIYFDKNNKGFNFNSAGFDTVIIFFEQNNKV